MTPAQLRRFKRLTDGLNKLLREVRVDHPGANYYMEGEAGLYILSGDSHDERGKMRYERVLANAQMPHASGGAW